VSAQKKKYVLAIDLGTSGPKAALVSSDYEAVATAFEPIKTHLLESGGAEQDTAEWRQAIDRAVKSLLEQGLVPREDIIAVGCTAQWSGAVPVDREGRPLAGAIIWMDSRGVEQIRELNRAALKIEGYHPRKIARWLRLTGGAPGHSGKDPVAHILYLKAKHPELYARTYKFLEPKDYLNLWLTGRFVSTHEAMTLHWVTDNRKIDEIRYDRQLLQMTGLEREKLPEMIRSTDIVGTLRPEIAGRWGFSEKVKVIGGTPDFHAVIIGAGAVRDFDPCLCIGTSTFLSCHYPRKKTDIFHNIAALPAGIPGKYLVMNEQEISGGALEFLKNNVLFSAGAPNDPSGGQDVYALFDHLAASVEPGSDGLIFTPWLYGERTPVEDAFVRGGFFNMKLTTTRAHLVRAVMEGVAYNTRWLLKYVEKLAGRRFKAINMVGGGALSAVWCQIFADVLQREIRQMKEPRYANVMGAAALALVAHKLITWEEIADKVVVNRIFQPQPANAPAYDRMFNAFLDIYRRNRRIYARLNGR
jgi:xylulokinase